MQTHSEENYLKAIFLLEKQENEKAGVTALAIALGNNPASVIDMFKKLKEKKLIEYDRNSGAKLTHSGLKIALLTVRKHRLWEMFLQEKLGYTWDEVHEIAEQLEHVQDGNLADRLDCFLGHPQFDPHGEAIPNREGMMPAIEEIILHLAQIGKSYIVVSVKDTSKSFLQYLAKLKISIGSEIEVLEKIDFDNSLTILTEKKEKISVSEKISMNILVRSRE